MRIAILTYIVCLCVHVYSIGLCYSGVAFRVDRSTEATKFELGRLDIHGMHAWVAGAYSADRPTYRCLIGANLLQKQHILSNGLSTFDTL